MLGSDTTPSTPAARPANSAAKNEISKLDIGVWPSAFTAESLSENNA
jgi:hypothetical protein